MVGKQILSYQELYTVSCQVEAILNSGPLSWQNNDPSDSLPLTPAHCSDANFVTRIADCH